MGIPKGWDQKEDTWSPSSLTHQLWDFQKVIYSPRTIISPNLKGAAVRMYPYLSFNSILEVSTTCLILGMWVLEDRWISKIHIFTALMEFTLAGNTDIDIKQL